MNFLLHKHNRPDFAVAVPPGLRELMMDISREVLRDQPSLISEYVADYLDALLVVRENTYITKHTLDDVIQFTLDMVDLMKMSGMAEDNAKAAANYLRTELKTYTSVGCVTEFNERFILAKLINEFGLDRSQASKVKKIIEESFKGYFYRFISYRDAKHGIFGVSWQQAVERTLHTYRMGQPEQSAMDRAAIVIQSAYRGFYDRKIQVKKKKMNAAAIVIQRVVRSYFARKNMGFTDSELLSRTSGKLALEVRRWPPPYENLDGVSLDYSTFTLT